MFLIEEFQMLNGFTKTMNIIANAGHHTPNVSEDYLHKKITLNELFAFALTEILDNGCYEHGSYCNPHISSTELEALLEKHRDEFK